MRSSNDGNNALVACNSSTLPAEQNDNISFFKLFRAKINLCELIFRGLYDDQECINVLYELVNFLMRNNQMLLAESIIDLLLSDRLTIDYRRHIPKKMMYFVKTGQMNAFYDFCNKNIPLSINARKAIEAQAISPIRINEAEYYSHLRIDEEREKSQILLSEEAARSQIRINEYRQKKKADAEIKLWFREEKHKQDLQFSAEAKKHKEEKSHTQTTMTPEIVAVDYLELEGSFIEKNCLVRVMRDGEPKIYRWDDATNRYISFIARTEIRTALSMYAYEKYGRQAELSPTQLDSVAHRMLYASVPLLNANIIKRSTDTQVFFKDGYLDIKIASNGHNYFYSVDTKAYFHVFCLPYIFEQGLFCPLAFDELLNYMFDNDEKKIALVYEIIGAILSNVPLKNVFVFHGVSNGGKSTLAEIIMSLFNEDEIKTIGSINEIDEVKSKKYEGKIKLLCIDDAPNERWSPQTVSYLKTRSSGIQRGLTSTFKILLSTNYPITFKTEDGRDESMEGRIVVVPFEKELKTGDKEKARIGEIISGFLNGSLNYELPYIAKEALMHFANFYNSNREFVHRYPLNECVINSGTEPSNIDGNTSNESKSKNSPMPFNATQKISDKNERLLKLLRENFERTDKEEEYLTADTVFQIIKELMPETDGRVQDIGKPVKAIFGDDCCWGKRKDNKTWYKIRRRLQNS